jgi:hypothetical protein
MEPASLVLTILASMNVKIFSQNNALVVGQQEEPVIAAVKTVVVHSNVLSCLPPRP